jgi:hypothetical protein
MILALYAGIQLHQKIHDNSHSHQMRNSPDQLYGHLTLLYARRTSHNHLVVLPPPAMAATVVLEVAVEADLRTCLGEARERVVGSFFFLRKKN